ncbi:retrovirus-related pol polyprotein from transposon TNT 1-94 [Tanacetum coccineum]
MQPLTSNQKYQKVEAHTRNAKPSLTKEDSESKSVCLTCKKCYFDARHDFCVVQHSSEVNDRARAKAVKSIKMKEWNPTSKMFKNVGYKWVPTGRTFTIVGTKCPLTRFTSTKIVPPRISVKSTTTLQAPFLKEKKGVRFSALYLQKKRNLLISQSPRGIFINQSKYALESVKKYGMESSNPVDSPMVDKSKLDEDIQGKVVDPTHYRGTVGTLMYLITSRPDLTFAYPKDSSIALTAYAGANHAGYQDTRRRMQSFTPEDTETLADEANVLCLRRLKQLAYELKNSGDSILQAGNLVKEILLKLNLPDHMSILTDSKVTPTKHGRMTNPYSSLRFIANCFITGYLKMKVKVPDSSCLKDS